MGNTQRIDQEEDFDTETIQHGNDESSHEQSRSWWLDIRNEETQHTVLTQRSENGESVRYCGECLSDVHGMLSVSSVRSSVRAHSVRAHSAGISIPSPSLAITQLQLKHQDTCITHLQLKHDNRYAELQDDLTGRDNPTHKLTPSHKKKDLDDEDDMPIGLDDAQEEADKTMKTLHALGEAQEEFEAMFESERSLEAAHEVRR